MLGLFNKSKKGEMGLSTLIIFLAMIMVSTITAQVLIQTSQGLQSTALEVGKRAQRQISTYVSVLSISADDGSDDSKIDNMYMQIRLSPASESIKLNDTLINIFTDNQKAELLYKEGSCTNDSTGFETIAGRGFYTVEYLKNSTNNKNGYVQSGEIVKICMQLPESAGESNQIKTTIIPKDAMPTTTTIRTPSTIYQKNIHLYP